MNTKFENEITQWFWEVLRDGCYDYDGELFYVLITDEDIKQFPELTESLGKYFLLGENNDGFVDSYGIVEKVPVCGGCGRCILWEIPPIQVPSRRRMI